MACRLEEIPEVGDYTVYDILDRSVIMLHTKDGVKAFHNACRHRGVQLARGRGNCKNCGFRCPFHGWRWNEDGESSFVFGREIFDEEIITRAQIDLAPVRVEFWAGCAFINFDDDAPSLRECLGPVADRMDARNADKLKMDWWFGTVLPTNWKLAMEAFQEGYHVMQTHPQLFKVSPNATLQFGRDFDNLPVHEGLTGKAMVNQMIAFLENLNDGMGGSMVHKTELAIIEKLRDMDVPEDGNEAALAFYTRACKEVEEDARARGADMFDIGKIFLSQDMHYVEFMFPHFFLLPVMGAMASYRIRPLTPETCLFEIWNLVIRPDDEPYDTPKEPTMLPYDSQDFPEDSASGLFQPADPADGPAQSRFHADRQWRRQGRRRHDQQLSAADRRLYRRARSQGSGPRVADCEQRLRRADPRHRVLTAWLRSNSPNSNIRTCRRRT